LTKRGFKLRGWTRREGRTLILWPGGKFASQKSSEELKELKRTPNQTYKRKTEPGEEGVSGGPLRRGTWGKRSL